MVTGAGARREKQVVLNACPAPETWREARWAAPDVRARVDWETDGVEHIETVALAWSESLVLVRLFDRRSSQHAIWLDIADTVRIV